jgi:plasmid stabilization system protein ParE
VPEYKVRTFREVFEADYRILYRVVPGGIEVVTVFHGSMQLNDPD